MRPSVEVVAAIIQKGDCIFATQRGYGDWKDWWEFPGGKMEAGESAEEALQREIREELSAEISVDALLCTVDYDYPKFHLTMHCYLCSLTTDTLHLNEHEAARWLTRGELDSVRWLPADTEVIRLLEMPIDYTTHYLSPIGELTLASDGERLVGLWFDGQAHFGNALLPTHCERHNLPVFEATRRWLDTYFAGRRPDFTPPLLLCGTAFRQTVWQLLQAIPYGQTTTYRDLAHHIDDIRGHASTAPRAIGNAVGHNPISIIIPCHRIVGADGSLTGYAGGIDRKRWLLQREGILLPD